MDFLFIIGWFLGGLSGILLFVDGLTSLWLVCRWFGWFVGGSSFTANGKKYKCSRNHVEMFVF